MPSSFILTIEISDGDMLSYGMELGVIAMIFFSLASRIAIFPDVPCISPLLTESRAALRTVALIVSYFIFIPYVFYYFVSDEEYLHRENKQLNTAFRSDRFLRAELYDPAVGCDL